MNFYIHITIQAQAQIQAQELAKARAQSEINGQAQQEPLQNTAESADVKSSEDDSSQLHRKVIQSKDSELEPVNLPQVHHHQPLTQTTSAPYHNRLRDTLSESEEPSEYNNMYSAILASSPIGQSQLSFKLLGPRRGGSTHVREYCTRGKYIHRIVVEWVDVFSHCGCRHMSQHLRLSHIQK